MADVFAAIGRQRGPSLATLYKNNQLGDAEERFACLPLGADWAGLKFADPYFKNILRISEQ